MIDHAHDTLPATPTARPERLKQLSLFAQAGRKRRQIARVTTSQTSCEAAEQIRPEVARLRQCVWSFIAGRGAVGASDDEIQAALQLDGSTERPRRCELRHDNLIEDSGIRRKTRSGRLAVVWIVKTNQGAPADGGSNE